MTTNLIQIAPALIAPSLTNPRKTFNAERLAELAASIQASGLHTPVLVRPLPAHRVAETGHLKPRPTHELVTGERRLRASIMAEQGEIPAIVRELTDAEALEIQVIENLQRDDLSALEEAEGYEYLIDHAREPGRLSVDELAAKIGKSRSYVYGRLKLLDLCQEGRQAMREGKLDASKALMVARVPTHKLQLRAIEALTETDHKGDTISARAASVWLRNNLMLRLDTAVFDIKDAKLCPNAGSCMQCPKRTGANPELFADVDSADVCTDTPCFHDKVEAHTAQIVAKARKKGMDVIEGKDAEKAKPYPGTHIVGYTPVDQKVDSDVAGEQTLRQLLKPAEAKSAIKVLIDPHTKQAIEVLPDDVADEVLERSRQQSAEATGRKPGKPQSAKDLERELREKREELEKQYQTSWRNRAVQQMEPQVLGGSLDRFEPDMLRALLFYLVCGENPPAGDVLEQLIGAVDTDWYEPKQALASLSKADDLTLGANLIVLLLRHEREASYTWNNGVLEFDQHAPMIEACAARLGVDLQAIKDGVKADMRALYAQLEEPADDVPSAAPAKNAAAGKPAKGTKTKPAPAKKLSAAEAKQGIADALQGEGSAADDGRGSQDGSSTAGDPAQPWWPFPGDKTATEQMGASAA